VKRYEDIKQVGSEFEPVDLICGGFPCQDISSAGKGAGLTGSRSGLWFEFARVIQHKKPEWVVVENVASGAKRWVDQVRANLGQLDYETLPVPLSAQDVGADHIRRRVFIVAHAVSKPLREQSWRGCGEDREGEAQLGFVGEDGDASDANQKRRYGRPRAPKEKGGWRQSADGHGNPDRNSKSAQPVNAQVAGVQSMAGDTSPWSTFPGICRVDDGLPNRTHRLRALGNAVVPQCAEVIGHIIKELSDV
jgi:DNA (cytosine-5)-methyltransferase 1